MRSQDVSPLLSSSAPLLCPLPHPRQDELAVQRRTPPGAPSSSTTTPHPASLRLLAASYLNSIRRGRQLFSNPSPPPPPLLLAVHSMIWHVFSFFPLSSFLFLFSFFWIRRLVLSAPLRTTITDKNTYTGIIVIYWCCFSCLLFFFVLIFLLTVILI